MESDMFGDIFVEDNEKLEEDTLPQVKQSAYSFKPVISSLKLEKENVVLDARKFAEARLQAVACERKKLVLSEKELRLDLCNIARQIADRKTCIEEETQNSEVICQELLSLKAEEEKKNHELIEKKKKVRESFEAHVIALNYYKKNLQCYLDFEDESWDTFTFYFFASDRNSLQKNYFVKLNFQSSGWTLLTMSPMLPSFRQLQENLSKSNDIQGFIAHVREQFILLKKTS